jgi:CheY-like chemotaxis protein
MRPPFLILVVDDNPLLLDLCTRAAKEHFPEASFLQVHSCPEAIQYIHQLDYFGPRLILLDIDLNSNQSGFTFLMFLKAHPQARFLPVIMLTVDESPATIDTAYEQWASSFTVKPDSFGGWKQYFLLLRQYWFNTATLPAVRFHKLVYWK